MENSVQAQGQAQRQESENPIFIVGLSRSGTSLIRHLLNNHPEIYIARETHYFADLRLRLRGRERVPLQPEEAKRCEDYFLSIASRSYSRRGAPEKSPIPREDLRALANQIGAGSDAYFEAYCRLQAQRVGKSRWGEKTPRHAFFIPLIFSCFPNAKVIYIVRDPRAVALSYRARGQREVDLDIEDEEIVQREKQLVERWEKSFHILTITFLWKNSVRAALEARQQFGAEQIYLLRYEDLVTNPEATLQSLTEWLGLEYHPGMSDLKWTNSSFSQGRVGSSISTEPVQRWRNALHPAEIAVIQAACGSLLTQAGYEVEPVQAPFWQRVLPWFTLPFAVLRASLVNRARIGNLPSYVGRQLRLLLKRSQ